MKDSEKLKFNLILTDLADMYDVELSDGKANGYWEALKDLSLDEVARASSILKQTAKFFPKPVEFRELLLPNLELLAVQAYDKVDGAFYSAGQYKTVIFDDKVIHAVITSMGGWVEYCQTPEKELKWWKKDFLKYYAMYTPKIDQMNPPKSLGGVFAESEGATEHAKEPMMIGDIQKILEWTGREVKALEGGNDE